MPVRGGQSDALIAIGSNIAPEENIPAALRLLRKQAPIVSVSTMYRSDPADGSDQPQFVNGACRIRSPFDPRELKYHVLRAIEAKLGRVRSEDKYAPREIDLDIALYGNTVLDEEGLVIPDPEIQYRPFLAVPLAEIAADWVLPRAGATLGEIAAGLRQAGLVPDPGVTANCRRAASEESQK